MHTHLTTICSSVNYNPDYGILSKQKILPVLQNLTNVDRSFQQESYRHDILVLLNQVVKQ